MMTTINRRAVLKATPAIAAGIAIPAEAMAAIPDRTEWEAAHAAYEHAQALDTAFDPEYWRVHGAWEAGKPSIDMIHWKEFPFADRNHIARTLDIEDQWQKFLAGQGKWWFARDPEARKARYRAALDSVRTFRDAEVQNDRASGMDEADDRWDVLADAVADTRGALMAMPAPDLAALRWKLSQLRDDDGGLVPWEQHYVQQTFADIDRLLPKGA